MADLVVTAANVVADSSASRVTGQAGEAITAGRAVYLSAITKKWMLADSNSATAEAKKAAGIALNGAALSQPLVVCTGGPVTMGATLVPGDPYYLSETPGGIQPATGLGAGENVCQLGLAISASVLNVAIQNPGVTK